MLHILKEYVLKNYYFLIKNLRCFLMNKLIFKRNLINNTGISYLIIIFKIMMMITIM